MKSSPHCLFSLLDLTKGHWTQKYVFYFFLPRQFVPANLSFIIIAAQPHRSSIVIFSLITYKMFCADRKKLYI